MDITSFKREVLEHYLDEDFQVTVSRDPSKWTSGNGLLHTGLFYTILGINNLLDDNDKARLLIAVSKCWVLGADKLPIYGLLNRNYGRPDKEAQDDYIGICAGGYFANKICPSFINLYGDHNHYSFDNTNPFHFSFSTFHGRFPGLIGFYRLSAQKDPGFIQTLSLCLKLRAGVSEDTSANILTWAQVQVLKHASSRFNKSIAVWEKSFNQKYGTIGDLFAPYFGSDHPFARLGQVN